jgi:hypothetical protein
MRPSNQLRPLLAMALSVSGIAIASLQPAMAMALRPNNEREIQLGHVQERAATELATLNRAFQKQVRDRLSAEDDFNQRQIETQIAPIVAGKNDAEKAGPAAKNSEEAFLSAAATIDPKSETSAP